MKYLKLFESFDIDDDSEHLKDLSLDLKDEEEWNVTVYTNTEKYNEDDYSCKVILEPLDVFDWDEEGINKKGGKINDTLIQYLDNIIRYMEDYVYRIILSSDNSTKEEAIILNTIEEFKNWIEEQLKHQQGNIMTYGFKGDLIIIEFYEKEINESVTFLGIKYKYDWCQPGSPIRKEIEEYIKDIITSNIEEIWRYTYHISWTQSNGPYIWISGKLKNNGLHIYKPLLSEIEPYIKQITSYLNSEGFSSEIKYFPNKENFTQVYIHFKMLET